MSKVIENFDILYNNPFNLTPIIVKFYETYQGKQPKDILLSYLILPLVLYEDSNAALKNRKKELRTFINYCQKKDLQKKHLEIKKNEKLFGLPDRVQEYKEITNLCLQYAFDTNCLQLNEDLSISFLKNNLKKESSSIQYIKIAENLACLFKNEKMTHIYMRLGIKKL
ncbi:three component ABC system middle component [Flavobacterium sp. MMS24-S5]|uniref:three component ABC system middle component n=1 Tax=Flavobacterium sp. MMS24-S5 TaxID=3416605 RepID=UPI003D0584FC